MILSDIPKVLDGKVVCGEARLNEEVAFAFASDMMSDVLTLQAHKFLLLTGLANVQTIRTAEMADIAYIVLVRNKKATQEILELARENNQVIIECPFSMFKACGILFQAGFKPLY